MKNLKKHTINVVYALTFFLHIFLLFVLYVDNTLGILNFVPVSLYLVLGYIINAIDIKFYHKFFGLLGLFLLTSGIVLTMTPHNPHGVPIDVMGFWIIFGSFFLFLLWILAAVVQHFFSVYKGTPQKRNDRIVVIFPIILCILIAATFFIMFHKSNEYTKEKIREREEELSNYEGTFKYDDTISSYYGDLIVNGYGVLTKRNAVFCEKNCKVFDYIEFKVTDTNNDFFDDYMGEANIVLGCLEKDYFWWTNDSDKYGLREYRSSLGILKTILKADSKNPTAIRIEKHLLTTGQGTPDCYSDFTEIRSGT